MRYVKAKRAAGSVNEETTHWIATFSTRTQTLPRIRRCGAGIRSGFKIVEFKPEPEVLTEAPPAALATSATPPKP